MFPFVGFNNPVNKFKIVLLPEPDSPKIPIIEFFSILQLYYSIIAYHDEI